MEGGARPPLRLELRVALLLGLVVGVTYYLLLTTYYVLRTTYYTLHTTHYAP